MGLNKPVDFTTAKLLKEKGFDEPKNTMYCRSVPMFENHHVVKFHDGNKHQCSNIPHDWNNTHSPIKSTSYFSAPTIAEVVMWCFNKYKYSIEYSMNIPESGEYDGCYVFNGLIKGSEDYKLKIFYTSKDYPTIEKALEAAIEYTLNNLI